MRQYSPPPQAKMIHGPPLQTAERNNAVGALMKDLRFVVEHPDLVRKRAFSREQLHEDRGGRVPVWLGQRMSRLGAIICQAIVHHYGRDEFLRRLSRPFWFQSFGAVMGMDWHSS